MKKIIVLLIAMMPVLSTAQMKVSDGEKLELVGEFKQLGMSYAKIQRSGELYTFDYRDDNFKQIDEYKFFTFRESDLDNLYNLFTNFEGVEKGQEKTVELETGGKLYFTYGKIMGKMYAEVIHVNKAGISGKIRWMNEKQFKKLFGKDK